jgi:hypothetical protein
MELEAIGGLVVLEAEAIFEAAGCLSDFCVQAVGECAVFGGTNRLLWSPRKGFRPDQAYCTIKFLEVFKRYETGDR